jgi:hypothetical protein
MRLDRKVSKIVEQLCGHLISASAVSAVTTRRSSATFPTLRTSDALSIICGTRSHM